MAGLNIQQNIDEAATRIASSFKAKDVIQATKDTAESAKSSELRAKLQEQLETSNKNIESIEKEQKNLETQIAAKGKGPKQPTKTWGGDLNASDEELQKNVDRINKTIETNTLKKSKLDPNDPDIKRKIINVNSLLSKANAAKQELEAEIKARATLKFNLEDRKKTLAAAKEERNKIYDAIIKGDKK